MTEIFQENIFLIKVVISFFTGGIFIALLTLLAEKYKKLSGLIISIPSTLPIGLFFIGWTQDKEAVTEALKIVPISLSILLIFATIFITASLFIKKSNFYKNLVQVNIISLLLWSILSYLVIHNNFTNIPYSLLIFIIIFLISYSIMNRKSIKADDIGLDKKNISVKKMNKSYVILIRSIFSGSIIMTSVILAKVFNPIWGGVFAMFPGAYISSFNILLISQKSNKALKRVGETISVGVVLFMIFAFMIMIFLNKFSTVTSLVLSELVIVMIIISISFKKNRKSQ